LKFISGTEKFIFFKINQKLRLFLEFTPHFPKELEKVKKHKFTPQLPLKALSFQPFCVLPPFDFDDF